MSPRERRLRADRDALRELSDRRPRIRIDADGEVPDRYWVNLEVEGLERDEHTVHLRNEHILGIYLPADYPRHAPLLEWRTPIFHPNILGPDRHGAVCIGSWSPSESLSDLVERIADLAGYRQFSLADPLDHVAAAWAKRVGLKPGARLGEVLAHA